VSCGGGVNAGDLRHSIDLRHILEVQDGVGEKITTWPDTYETAFASIRQMQGSELVHAQQISAVATHKIRIRYLATIVTTDRIFFGSREFEISAPPMNYQERNIYQDILCKEVVQ
jgi:SPP1 family predicted phage head-tail adaptor